MVESNVNIMKWTELTSMALKERKALAKVLAAALSGFRRSWFSLCLNRAAVHHSGGGRAAVSGKRRGARRDRRAGL